jgi:hypothetical protein
MMTQTYEDRKVKAQADLKILLDEADEQIEKYGSTPKYLEDQIADLRWTIRDIDRWIAIFTK